jgi:hypothetical protein
VIRVSRSGELPHMSWSDHVDAIIDGDLTAGLAYVAM